jgi:hypothetical protein
MQAARRPAKFRRGNDGLPGATSEFPRALEVDHKIVLSAFSDRATPRIQIGIIPDDVTSIELGYNLALPFAMSPT